MCFNPPTPPNPLSARYASRCPTGYPALSQDVVGWSYKRMVKPFKKAGMISLQFIDFALIGASSYQPSPDGEEITS